MTGGLVSRYALAMRRRGLAEGTVYTRTAELRRWLEHSGGRWAQASRQDVDEWLDRRPLGARARYTAISHLSMFYRWAIREGLATVDPTQQVERPKLPRRLPRPIPRAQCDVLLDGAGDLHLTVLLMLDAGLRCIEASRLRWYDVDLERGTLFVFGKGSRERLVGTPIRLRHALYLAAADAAVSSYVIGAELTPAQVSQRIGLRCRELGLRGVTAHRLRHTYASRLYEATAGDLGAVQLALGHASVATTQIYAHIDAERALRAARALDQEGAA